LIGNKDVGYNSVIVVVAALNEEEGIGPTIADLKQHLDRPYILVVDGNSRDKTVQIAKAMGADVACQDDCGKGNAIATALAHTRANGFKYVAFIDADYTYPAKFLPEMVRLLEKDTEVGMVCGNRTFFERSYMVAMGNIFILGNRLLAFTHNFFNGVKLHDPLTGLRVVRSDALKGWNPMSKGFDIEVEMNHCVERMGYRIVEIPISYRERLGEKKLGIRHGFTILNRILRESLRTD
jgi:dolichol-phosphate mannosyltransferase